MNIIKRAIEEPLRQIVFNAALDPSIVFDKVLNGKGSFGFNARTEEYGDLLAQGVIDPTKVVRTALLNASYVARLDAHHRLHDRREAQERPTRSITGWRHGRYARRHGLLKTYDASAS